MSNISQSKLDDLISGGGFEALATGNSKNKAKAVTINSAGVITYNTPLKKSVYNAGRNASIRINAKTNQLLIISGDDIEDANGSFGQVNPSISAIGVMREIEEKHCIKVLPNGTKTSSYRFEETNGGLEVLQEPTKDNKTLAVLLNLSKRRRNPKGTVERVEGAELTAKEKEELTN